jgi:hypothetical protein
VGPSCVIEGKCHQGKKSCGKMAEVRDYFEQFRAEPSS